MIREAILDSPRLRQAARRSHVPDGGSAKLEGTDMALSETRTALDQAARARLAQFANALIAGSPGWPSASEAEVHDVWIDRSLAARPDLVAIVTSVLAAAGEPREVLNELRTCDPGRFENFSSLVAGAYLMNPRVRRKLGLPAGAPERNPPYPDEADFYLEGGLLDPVIARGSAGFRRTPPPQ